MLLLREKIITTSELGATELVYNDVNTHSQSNLQKLSDYVVAKTLAENSVQDQSAKQCTMLNGLTIDIPIWYLLNQGHHLEDMLLKAFPKLNELKKQKEDKLKLAIIEKVIDDFPTLISLDVANALKKIQV